MSFCVVCECVQPQDGISLVYHRLTQLLTVATLEGTLERYLTFCPSPISLSPVCPSSVCLFRPVFLENGQVAGMAFSGFAGTADNIGYVIPCCVISVSVSVRPLVCVSSV